MKVLKILLVVFLILAGLGYGLYYFGTNVASDKIMEVVSAELESSGELDAIKELVANGSELQQFIEEGAMIDSSNLPFQSKEEAIRAVVKKLGVSELQNIASEVQAGTMSTEELMSIAESNLTEKEIQALKVIAYKELVQ